MGRSYCSEVFKERVLRRKGNRRLTTGHSGLREKLYLLLGMLLDYIILRAESILTFAMFWKGKDVLYLPIAFQNYRDEIPGILSLF